MARKIDVNSPVRKAIFDFIIVYKVKNDGVAPTVREIMSATGIKSTSSVNYHLLVLEHQEKISVEASQPRGIRVIGGHWVPPA